MLQRDRRLMREGRNAKGERGKIRGWGTVYTTGRCAKGREEVRMLGIDRWNGMGWAWRGVHDTDGEPTTPKANFMTRMASARP